MGIKITHFYEDKIKELKKQAKADKLEADLEGFWDGHQAGYDIATRVAAKKLHDVRNHWYNFVCDISDYYETRAIRHKRIYFIGGAVTGAVAVALAFLVGYVV